MDDLAQPFARRARDGDECFVRAEIVADLVDARNGTAHLDAANDRAPLRALIVDERDDLHAQLRTMLDLARERFARVAGADDDDAFHGFRQLGGAESIAAEADDHARTEEREKRE